MGGTTKTKSTSQSDPWAPAQPALKQVLSGAQDAYNTTYQGPQVAAMDPNVTAAQNAMLANAQGGQISGLANVGAQNIGSVLNAGGLSGMQWGAAGGMADALGNFNATSGQAQNYLTPFASGAMRGANPYLNESIENSMSQASDAVNRQFSASGRYGSGAHSGALGSSLGRIATDARMQAYNQDTANQMAAIGQLGNMAGNNLSGNLSGLGAIGNMGQQGFQNTQAGVSGLGELNNARNLDASSMAQVGGQRMDYNQMLIDAQNTAPWARVGNLAQIAGGIAGLGGTQSGTQTQRQGGAAPVIGAVMGGIGGLANMAKMFAMPSDERIKEDITPVGKLDNGEKVYAYRYKGDPRTQIGLLAQEVEKRTPEAVVEHPHGYKMVDYKLATRKKREAA